MNYRDEQEIDLIDLCMQILKKWKLILVFMLIGLVLGGSVGFIRTQTVDSETLKPIDDKETVSQNLEELKEELSDREVTETELAVDAYRSYKKLYSDRLNYGKKSIRMKLNAESVPTLNATYIIGDYYEVTYPTIDKATCINNIIKIYSDKLYDRPVVDEVSKALGGKIAETYVRELYSVYLTGDSILNITVTARSKEECQTVMDVLEKYFEEAVPYAKEQCSHSIKYLNTNYSRNMSTGLISEQKGQTDTLEALENSMISASSSLTADQKAYFKALIDDEFSNEHDIIVVRKFSLKFAALGLVAGAFLVMAFVCITYVLSQAIKTKDEITSLFGVKLLGVLNDKAEGELGMIAAGAGLGAKKAKVSKVYITGSLSDKTVSDSIAQMVDAIKTNYSDLVIENGNSILSDPASFASLAESEAVIFVEKLRQSKYDDIAKEIEIAGNYEVKVLGAVVVE